MEVRYALDMDFVVYENEYFFVDVGPYPDLELDVYRIHNKGTGVIEHAHSVLYYARKWADDAARYMKGTEEAPPEHVIFVGGNLPDGDLPGL